MDLFETMQKGLDRMSILGFIGVELVSVKEGEVVLAVENKPEIQQHIGYVHGGVLATLADTCAGMAAMTVLEKRQTVVTSEFKIHYLRPATSATIHAIGTILKKGSRQIIVEAEIIDPATSTLIGKFIGTMVPVDAN